MSKRKQTTSNPNTNFCQLLMAKGCQVDTDLDGAKLLIKSEAVAAKLKELQKEDRQEWTEIQVNKLRQMAKRMAEQGRRSSKAERQAVRVFVMTCQKAGIECEREADQDIEVILKRLYRARYDERKLAPLFLKAGYSAHIQEEEEEVIDLRGRERGGLLRMFMCCCSFD